MSTTQTNNNKVTTSISTTKSESKNKAKTEVPNEKEMPELAKRIIQQALDNKGPESPRVKLSQIIFPNFDSRAPGSKLDPAFEESVKANGVLEPVLVCHIADTDNYLLLAGRKRYRASEIAKFPTIPICVLSVPENVNLDDFAMTIAHTENADRTELTDWDKIYVFTDLHNRNKWTNERIGAVYKIVGTSVSQYITVGKLPKKVLDLLEPKLRGGRGWFSKARTLCALSDHPEALYEMTERAIKDDLEERTIRELIADFLAQLKVARTKEKEKDKTKAKSKNTKQEEPVKEVEENPYSNMKLEMTGVKLMRTILYNAENRVKNLKSRNAKPETIEYAKGYRDALLAVSSQKDFPEFLTTER